MERFAQGEVYRPVYKEDHDGITAISFAVMRLTDNYYYDFNDSTFKASGWTTPYQALAEQSNPKGSGENTWTYSAGWTIPSANAQYRIEFEITDASSTYYKDGDTLIINSNYLDILADSTNGLSAIKAEVEGLGGEAMRGTDSAALASVCTETRLARLNADIDSRAPSSEYDTEMARITDARMQELDAANLPADIDTLLARVTAAVATATALATAQTNLDTITGADGVTLATLQGNYAPNKVVPDAAGTTPTLAQIIAGIADGDYDLQEMLRIIFAACSGISSGGGTSSHKYRDSADSKDRITATVDANGNRTAVTLDGS